MKKIDIYSLRHEIEKRSLDDPKFRFIVALICGITCIFLAILLYFGFIDINYTSISGIYVNSMYMSKFFFGIGCVFFLFVYWEFVKLKKPIKISEKDKTLKLLNEMLDKNVGGWRIGILLFAIPSKVFLISIIFKFYSLSLLWTLSIYSFVCVLIIVMASKIIEWQQREECKAIKKFLNQNPKYAEIIKKGGKNDKN